MVHLNDKLSNEAKVVKLPPRFGIKPRPKVLPMAVPEDLADRLMRFHGNPSVWWIGQFVKYLTRPNKQTMKEFAARKKMLGFKGPVVGVQVRRTDKLKKEATYHGIEEYMQAVEEWFNVYEKRHPNVARRVYLATDEPSVLKEAKQRYSNYTFISDTTGTASAGLGTRYSDASLRGIIKDIHFLSRCDFLVCTFSSNVGRAAYELMQTLHGDASQCAKSIDRIFFFSDQNEHYVEAVDMHNAQINTKQIELQPKDLVKFRDDFWNGYSFGINSRTGTRGLFPSYKVVDTVDRVKMPVYDNVR